MKLVSAYSHSVSVDNAIKEMRRQIPQDIQPSLILCYYTEEYCPQELSTDLTKQFAHSVIMGASSCKGIMTDKGFHLGPVVGILAIIDTPSSAYASAITSLDDCPDVGLATQRALNAALAKCGRTGEQPDLVVLHTSSGAEEIAIDKINAEFGGYVPLLGGTAADNKITGDWSLFSHEFAYKSAVSVTVLFPSQPVTAGFQAGYSATEHFGTVTKVKGRELIEIDHKPCLDVYKSWIALSDNVTLYDDQTLFEHTNSFPFGRVSYGVDEQPLYNLAHPTQIGPHGGIETFTSIQEGETVHLMSGSKQRLISRAERVIETAKQSHLVNSSPIGSISIFCAGSMLNIEKTMNQVSQQIHNALDKKSYICPFTFGEQGGFNAGVNSHGNLMISSAVFHT